MQKRNGLCRFDKAKPGEHIHLTDFQNVLYDKQGAT